MRIFLKGGSWTNAEDQALLALVQKVGLNRWTSISTTIGHKSPEQCQQRWVEFLDPAINKGEWTREETRKLLQCYEIFPDQWQSIASQLPGRRPWQCQERYSQVRAQGLGVDDDKAHTGDNDGGVDGETVTSGDYKLYHEMREAKADTVDGDEYSTQVTEFTRSRLANQKGKKQLRKEKQVLLNQTKLLTTLERKREMEAAGIETHNQKKAFRRAVEEDQKGRRMGDTAVDDDDDNATADLAQVMGSEAFLRQAASHKKTVLVADNESNAINKRKAGVALIPGFEAYTNAPRVPSAQGIVATTYSTPSSTTAVLGGYDSHNSLAPAPPKLTIDNNGNNALSALMTKYLGGGENDKALVSGGAEAQSVKNVSQTNENVLSFDDLAPPVNRTAADDLFADLASPIKTTVDAPVSAQLIPSSSAIDKVVGKEPEDADEEEEEAEENDEESEDGEPINYVYKALNLLQHESRIHWEAKGDWESPEQSLLYLRKARDLIDKEQAVVMDPLGQYKSDKSDNDNLENVSETLPPLVHPRVLELMSFNRANLIYPSTATILEDAIEVEATKIAAAQAIGIESSNTVIFSSKISSPFCINDSPLICEAEKRVLEESDKLATALDALKYYQMAFELEMAEVLRRRAYNKSATTSGPLVKPNTKRTRDEDELVETNAVSIPAIHAGVLDFIRQSYGN